jgi:hypothetical protein
MTGRRMLRAGVAGLALVVLVGACDDPSERSVVEVDSAPSQLRASFTATLDEHVYLAGIAINTALSGGNFDAAATTLDANSVALAESIGSVYGRQARTKFLDGWRDHIGFFVDYANARATGDDVAADEASADLAQYRRDFGLLLASVNPSLEPEAGAELLIPHIDAMLAVIDSAAAGDAQTFDLLRDTAGHMPHLAMVLSGSITEQFPDRFGADAP